MRKIWCKVAAKDNEVAKKGEKYYFWRVWPGEYVRSKTFPRKSQLTASTFLKGYFEIQEYIEDTLPKCTTIRELWQVVEKVQLYIVEAIAHQETVMARLGADLKSTSGVAASRISLLEQWLEDLNYVGLNECDTVRESVSTMKREIAASDPQIFANTGDALKSMMTRKKKGERSMARRFKKKSEESKETVKKSDEYMTMKKWASGLGLKSFGVKKDKLTTDLLQAMADHKDALSEQQLKWYEEKTKEFGEPKPEPRPTKTRKKKDAEDQEVVMTATGDTLDGFAEELGIEPVKDLNELASAIYEKVLYMSHEDREGLSPELLEFFMDVKGNDPDPADEMGAKEEKPAPRRRKKAKEEPEPDDEDVPTEVQLKRWSELLGVSMKGKEREEVILEMLETYEEDVEEDDKERFPESLVEWADGQLEKAASTLPDWGTLKEFAKEVGLEFKDIKKASKSSEALANMILTVYDEEEEESYSPDLLHWVQSTVKAPVEDVTEDAEPAPVGEREPEGEDEYSALRDWLVSVGYNEDQTYEADPDLILECLEDEFNDPDTDVPQEMLDILADHKPELFPKPEKPKKKPAGKRRRVRLVK